MLDQNIGWFQNIGGSLSRRQNAWCKSSVTRLLPLFWAVKFSPSSFSFSSESNQSQWTIEEWGDCQVLVRSRTFVTVLIIFSFLSIHHASSFILCVFKFVCFVSHYLHLLCLFWWGKIVLADKLLTVSLPRNSSLINGDCLRESVDSASSFSTDIFKYCKN